MTDHENAKFMLDMLAMIERRDVRRIGALYHPDVEFKWQPGLPYSGVFQGLPEVATMTQRFRATWEALQPDEETRRMHARVVATGDDGQVVCHYRWKGMDATGRRFETDTLAEYHVRDGMLARAHMYYFDLPGLIAFLERARAPGGSA
jgi:ketosteroid isomerase-like protein